jgi:hypothetical protein
VVAKKLYSLKPQSDPNIYGINNLLYHVNRKFDTFDRTTMSSTTSQNPLDIIDGPRKRQPTKRVTENGDTLANKRAKTSAAARTSKVSTVSNNSHRASVEDVLEPALPSRPQLHLAERVLKAADGSDDDSFYDDMPILEDIEAEDDDDDDEAELGIFKSFPGLSAY